MKRFKNLYPQVYDLENLRQAFRKAKRNKAKKFYVIEFEKNLEANLMEIQKELKDESWQPLTYKVFTTFDPKQRLIHAPRFRDRIVQHALMAILEPLYTPILIYDSYASLKHKGTHLAVDRLTGFLRRHENPLYCLKCDVRKFFDTIDHEILIQILRKKIGDERVITLIKKILVCGDITKGVTLGNFTSQWFANIYLNELDYFAKHILKAKEYVRYMDDFVILSESKDQLHDMKKQVDAFLQTLKLQLHPRKQEIFPVAQGIDFLGYVIWHDHRKLRRRNVWRFIHRLQGFERLSSQATTDHIKSSIMSWKGYAQHADSYGLNRKLRQQHPLLEAVYG
jgi:retron-type reverse transcriptase